MKKDVVLIVVVALAGMLYFQSCNNAEKSTVAEVKIPGFDVSSMDTTVNPCDDFDQYVNGNWKKKNPIPSTEGSWGSFDILDKETREVKVKGIVNELLSKNDYVKGSDAQLITDYFRSYMDTATIEKRGLSPIQPYIERINAANNLNDLIALSGELEKYGVSAFTNIGVGSDDRNSKMNAVFMGQSGLSLDDRNYYENQDSAMVNIRVEFVKHIDKMFSMAGWADKNPGKTILDFETKLALLQLKNFEQRDPVKTYNKIAFADLATLAPDINWNGYYENYNVKSDSIVVTDKNYLKNANQLLKQTPIETLKTWYRWGVISSFAYQLPNRFTLESFHFFSTIMAGVKEIRPREERVIMSINGRLGMPMGKLFVEKYFPESSKKKVSEMIENVRAAYLERIDKLTWMSDSTKVKAKAKLAAFTYKIGYPDKWKDYSTIDIQTDKLFENCINIALWRHNDQVKKIGQPVDRAEWIMSPQTINAYNNPTNNEIVFPAAILQPPFFNPDADDAINYGGIIGVIGHEFTHGFDDSGSQYDGHGNLNNWWTLNDRKNFDDLGKKYIEYFNTMEVTKGFTIDGKLTLGENIADLGGLTLGYYALEKSLEGKPKPEDIDGLNYKQRFFIGWAQVWHENTTKEALINQVQTNPHSPAHWRINCPMSHMKEFAEAWKCTSGKMVIPDSMRVVIW